jgi:hypothetical protein
VERLRAEIGIPNRLRELGAEEQLRPFAEKAFGISAFSASTRGR